MKNTELMMNLCARDEVLVIYKGSEKLSVE